MKKQILTFAMLLSGFAMLVSCNKETHTPPTIVTNTVNVNLEQTLANKEVYTLDLSQYGDADDVSIIVQQATAYTTSQIDVATTATDKRGTYTYMYDAANLTTGKMIVPVILDSVILKVTEGEHLEHHDCNGGGGNRPPHPDGNHPKGGGLHLFHKADTDAPKTIVENEYLIKVKFTISPAAVAAKAITTTKTISTKE